MFSLKYLTKKFNKQTLSEVKPAPLSETVDHTVPVFKSSTIPFDVSSTVSTPPESPTIPPPPFPPPPADHDHTPPSIHPYLTSGNNNSSTFTDNHTTALYNHNHHLLPDHQDSLPSMHLLSSSPTNTVSSYSLSSLSSSDSEDSEEEASPLSRFKGPPHSPRGSPPASQQQHKIERISSAEKRKYSQYKRSTGSSSPSSSDDEIKEAFDSNSTRHRNHSPPTHHAWGVGGQFSSSSSGVPTGFVSSSKQPLPGWKIDPFEAAGRPLKVVPLDRHKHKFFAQMSSSFSDRPYLDFNKMQHSKRLVMVRRPMVTRNNSRVHSIQRPSASNLQVSLDISQHSFQPVLTQM